MKIMKMKLKDIIPAEYNPRVTLEEGDTEYEALKNSISRFGLVEPLVVNQRNNVLIGGHQRYNVLKAQGQAEADVVLVDLDEKQEKELNVSLNKIEGDWDTYKLEELLRDIDNEDIIYTGFSEEEIDNIIGLNNEEQIEEIAKETYPPKEMGVGEYEEDDEEMFDIYFSFPSKSSAENWLKEHGFDSEIDDRLRSVTIHMEEYHA